jgi:hypothetical protein
MDLHGGPPPRLPWRGVLALLAAACAQPLPDCNVVASAAAAGRSPYLALLTPLDAGCPAARVPSTLWLGVQRFQRDYQASQYTLGVRPSLLVDMYEGTTFELDGAPAPRVDPTDPEGNRMTMVGDLTRMPSGGVCTASGFAPAVEDFPALPAQDGDGGLPALSARLALPRLQVVSSATVHGTYLSGQLDYTEDGCTDALSFIAFWPVLDCATDLDCQPFGAGDGGAGTFATLSPVMKPVCRLDLGVCVPTASLEELTASSAAP